MENVQGLSDGFRAYCQGMRLKALKVEPPPEFRRYWEGLREGYEAGKALFEPPEKRRE